MSNYYVPCFFRIDFVVILCYIELPCFRVELYNMTKWLSDDTNHFREIHIFARADTIYNTLAFRMHVTHRTQRHSNFDGISSY